MIRFCVCVHTCAGVCVCVGVCMVVNKKQLVAIQSTELGVTGLGIKTLHIESLKCACVYLCVRLPGLQNTSVLPTSPGCRTRTMGLKLFLVNKHPHKLKQ